MPAEACGGGGGGGEEGVGVKRRREGEGVAAGDGRVEVGDRRKISRTRLTEEEKKEKESLKEASWADFLGPRVFAFLLFW
jgi:hypothetical protein